MAVDPLSGDVYLDNEGSVAAFTPAGGLIQRFGAGELNGASGIAVDGASEQVLVAEPASDQVLVFMGEEETGAPEVDDISAQNLTPDLDSAAGPDRPEGPSDGIRASSTEPATARATRQRAPACRRAIWPPALAIRASASK